MNSINNREHWGEYKRQYEQHGLLIIDLEMDEKILTSLASDLANWFEKKELPVEHKSTFNNTRVHDAWLFDERVKHIAVQQKVLDLLQYLYQGTPFPFQTINFPYGTQQRLHADTIHFNTEPFGLMCGVWLALEDVAEDQGPLVYYPGSHKLPEMNFEDLGLVPQGPNFDEYSVKIKQVVKEKCGTPRYGILKKGQAVIWAANLIHGGSIRKSNKTRLSQVTHYLFEDCKYWRPSQSMQGRKYFEPMRVDGKSSAKLKGEGWLRKIKSKLKKSKVEN